MSTNGAEGNFGSPASAAQQTNGGFTHAFSNSVGALFGVRVTTNLSLLQTNWTALGGVVKVVPGKFQFTDAQATNMPNKFYRVTGA